MPALTDRLHPARRSAFVARAAATFAAALALVMLVRFALAVASPAQLPVTLPPSTSPGTSHDIFSLSDWHLFGLPADASEALPLARQLRGVAATPDPARGLAFLTDAAGGDGSYRVGESLPGGSVLMAVHADGIEILHQGQRRRVALAPEPAAPEPRIPQAPEPAAALAGVAPEVAPVIRDGRLLGLNVAFADASLRESLGLRPDDLVLTVDGRAADSPGLADTLEQRLARGDALRLGVRRGGSDLTLDLATRNP
jgi:type II secretory pathway component PulC